MITFSPNTKIKSGEVNQNFTDLSTGVGQVPNNSLLTFKKEEFISHVLLGLVVPTSASLTTTIASGGVALINGTRQSFSAISRAYTASKDTYVDIKDDGTFTYVEVANGATAGMALTLNSDGTNALRIAKVVTSGSAVTSVTQSGVDPLGNTIYNQNRLGWYTSTVANTGTAGGNLVLMVMGGVRMLWSKSPNYTGGNQGTRTYVIPAGWFNTVGAALCTGNEGTVDANLHWWLDGATPASPIAGFTLTFNKYNNNNGGGDLKSSLFVVGT